MISFAKLTKHFNSYVKIIRFCELTSNKNKVRIVLLSAINMEATISRGTDTKF